MKRNIKRYGNLVLVLIGTLFILGETATTISGQTTAFNFQGRLNDGSIPANGRYDLQFKLYDAIAGGNQIGPTLDKPNTMLVNGVFSTPLDFGSGAFTVNNRFLEISLRPNGVPNAFVILGARQQIMSVPLAIRSISSGYADNAGHAVNADDSVISQNALSLGGVGASEFLKRDINNTGNLILTGNIQTNGNINASGTLTSAGNIATAGNATQNTAKFGLPKAMVEINDNLVSGTVTIIKCYNGFTGASTPGTCDFTVSGNMKGVYQINFGFPVNDHFVSAIARYNSSIGGTGNNNIGVNYEFTPGDNSSIRVFTFLSGNSDDTSRADFVLIVY